VREARSLHADGLRLRRDAGDRIGVSESFEGIAELGAAAGHMERAVQLVGAASAERRRLRTPSSPMDRERLEAWLPRAAAVLGEDRLAQAQAVGEGMPIDEAYALALAETEAVARSSPGAAHREVGPLTARQEEVAVLVAQGWTNRRIAERLVITERTAAAHIERILHRLDFTSRTQIGVWAAEHDLLTAVTS
jgi:non-specific serine/threonine protein kinase